MINPDDIKAGMVLGQADAEILRDAISRLNGMELELLALHKVHEGWQMVPIEPTSEMCETSHVGVDPYAGIASDGEIYSIGGEDAAKVYRAMLAAAPDPE